MLLFFATMAEGTRILCLLSEIISTVVLLVVSFVFASIFGHALLHIELCDIDNNTSKTNNSIYNSNDNIYIYIY